MSKKAFYMAFMVALTACAQDASTASHASKQTDKTNALPQSAPLEPIRVILQLRSSSTDFASAAFLQQLQAQTEAPVHYLASVSNDTHVYSFAPAPGQTYAQIVERLRSLPAVARVSLDQKISPQ
jgi:hypothetical protein